MIFKCVCAVPVLSQEFSKTTQLTEERTCVRPCFNLEKTASETYKLLKKKKTFCDDAKTRPQTWNDIHISKDVKFGLGQNFKYSADNHQVGLMKIWRKCIRSSTRTAYN